MANVLAELLVKITTDVKGLNTGLGNAEKQCQNSYGNIMKLGKQVGIAMTAVGGSIVAAAVLSVKSYAQMGSAIHDMSLRTGFATETISELKYMAEQSGGSIEGLEVGIKRMSVFMTDASKGTGEAAEALSGLGMTLDDIKGLKPEEIFYKLLTQIAKLPDPMQRSAIAVQVFGRSGTALLPILENGAEGIEELRQQAHDLGIVFDQEAADSADKFGDILNNLEQAVTGLRNEIGGIVAEALTPMVEKVVDLVSGFTEWAKENPTLSRNVILFTTALGGLLAVLGTLLITINMMRTALVGLNIALGPVGWAITLISLAATAAIPVLASLNEEMDDLEKQAIRTKVQAEFTARGWGELGAKARLSAEEFKSLADALGMTTEELQDNLATAGLLQKETVWGWDAFMDKLHGVIYLEQDLEKVTEKTTDAQVEQVEAAQDLAKQQQYLTREIERAINDQMDVYREAHSARMDALQDEYDAQIRNINATLDAQLAGYQAEINALDAQLDAMDKEEKDQRNKEKKASLKAQIDAATEADEKADLEKELADFLEDLRKEGIRDEIRDKQKALRQAMDMARQEAEDAQENARDTYETKRNMLDREYNALISNLENSKRILDKAFDENLERYDIDLTAFKELLASEEIETEEFVKVLNDLLDSIKDKTINIDILTRTAAARGGGGDEGYTAAETAAYYGGIISGATPLVAGELFYGAYWAQGHYQHGGIAWTPQIASIAETEPEAIIPLSKLNQGGVTINFTEPVFFDREDSMNKFIAKIKKALNRDYRVSTGAGLYA